MPGLFHFLFEGPDTEVGLAGPARYAVGFAGLALWGYRRDEGADYR